MFILEPIIHETIWGGYKLCKYMDKWEGKIGHLYLVNGHKQMSNIILNGDYKGKTLRDVFRIQASDWNMEQYEEFPLTIALVDASDNLSIQVHPDDTITEKLEGQGIGKMESWLFLDEPYEGWIYDGCVCDTKEQVECAVNVNRMEEITEKIEIHHNDYVCIEPGTLHAMTAGSLVYEIEYGSDYTYRFYDYNRKDEEGNVRELHIEKAVKAIKPEIIASVKTNIGEQWISEEKYEIRKVKNIEIYQNDSNGIECLYRTSVV